MTGDSGQEFKAPARFQIHRRLGSGGFGVVYEAYDRQREAVIALKELRRSDAGALYWFKREFRALADLTHPNLVTLHELISEQDQWLLAMELIRGANFLDYVQDVPLPGALPQVSTSLPLAGATAPTIAALVDSKGREGRSDHEPPLARFHSDRLRSGLRQLAEGIGHLHRHGILHRDIKPSNVLVTTAGRVVLLDFGLATELASEERSDSRAMAGTPEYMSPEQAAGEMLSEASDWYSVGVVLYRALTGRLPFAGSFLTMLTDKQQREPIPPSELVRGLPHDLESLCRDLLRRDPLARPSGADVLARLSGESFPLVPVPAPPRPPQAHPFVGRHQQLAVLREALQATRSGKTVTLYLQGSSGMGKTALVRHFLHSVRASQGDVVVFTGRCYEQEAVPYKALDSLVDDLTQYLKGLPRSAAESLLPRGMWALARVFPVLQRVEAVTATPRPAAETGDWHELRRRASAAFREMLGRLAERHPLILFIDDLQWGDVDSASLLTELLRPPDQPALLMIACYRGEEAESNPVLRTLRTLHASEGATTEVRTLEVGELSPLEADELAHALMGDDQAASGRAEVIARESGGHPFFIDQLVRHGQTDSSETSLDRVLLGRAAQLPAASRTLLEVTAVAGRPLEIAVASKAADLESGTYDVLAALRAAQFIRTRLTDDEREVEPYHDRVRETIVASLSADALKRHHHRLALALEGSARADPEALAVHFQGAGDAGKAARYALTAAEQAAGALAFERAARLYRLTLELQPEERPDRRLVCVKLGDALAHNGRVIEAAQAYLSAAAGADPDERSELLRQAAEQFLMGGHLDEGLELLRTVLRAAGFALPATRRRALLWIILRRPYMLLRGTRFRARPEHEIPADELRRIDLCHSAVRSLGFTETVYAIELQMRHLLIALKVGEVYRVARALGFEANAEGRQRRSRPRAERLLKQARELAEGIEEPHKADAGANIHVTAGMLAFHSGRWKTASRELHQAEQIFREQSALPYKLVVCQIYTLNALYHAGELTEYFRRVPECLKESLDRGNVFAEANLRLQNAHRTCFGDDHPEGALEEVREAMARWSPRGFHQVHVSELFQQVDIALYRGDARTAWDTLGERWPRLSRSFLLGLQSILIPALYLRARAALAMAAESDRGRDTFDRFLRAAERDAHKIECEKSPWGAAVAQLVRAGVAVGRGDREHGVALLSMAEAGFDHADMALHAAVARSRRGLLIEGDEGDALINSATTWMRGQGLANPLRINATFAPGRWA